MHTPEGLDGQFTLRTAAIRLDELRAREALASFAEDVSDAAPPAPLGCAEALELLALSEVLARKAHYGRQLSVRTARAAGASWSQIGAALGISKQAAWEAHGQWIDSQSEAHRRTGYAGLDDDAARAARILAGDPEQEPA
jgi:hypothetical protein